MTEMIPSEYTKLIQPVTTDAASGGMNILKFKIIGGVVLAVVGTISGYFLYKYIAKWWNNRKIKPIGSPLNFSKITDSIPFMNKAFVPDKPVISKPKYPKYPYRLPATKPSIPNIKIRAPKKVSIPRWKF